MDSFMNLIVFADVLIFINCFKLDRLDMKCNNFNAKEFFIYIV